MREDETAGALEPFEDATLYDWEYRRRRDDVRLLSHARRRARRPGARPRLRHGAPHGAAARATATSSSGVDHARRDARPRRGARRAAAAERGGAAPCSCAATCAGWPLEAAPRFAFAIVAFHGIQHLVTDAELLGFFRARARRAHPGRLARLRRVRARPGVPGARASGRPRAALAPHALSPPRDGPARGVLGELRVRRASAHAAHDVPLPARRRPRPRGAGPERHVRLCHRQLEPTAVADLLTRAGLALLQSWGDFRGAPLEPLDVGRQRAARLIWREESDAFTDARGQTRAKSAGNTAKKPCLRRNSDGISLDRVPPPATMPRSSQTF